MPQGTLEKARGALVRTDFRRLFTIRLVSQFADGLFQASLVSSAVFSSERTNTLTGLFWASLIIALPFSVLGPFVGVFIDRWSRRKIMWVAPLLRAALVALVLFDPQRAGILFFGGALWVSSVNRFFLSTAQAVVPRLVPTEDLLVANSLATVGGTVALLLGVTAGGQIAAAAGSGPIVAICIVAWVAASWIARRIGCDLGPHDRASASVGRQLGLVWREMRDGARHLFGAPRAVGPITSISLDQLAQGVVLALSLVVFKERFKEGVGSFGWLIGAGGVGVLIGLSTVGRLEDRFSKERIVAGSFALSGILVLAASTHITGVTVLLASFAVGLTFAWKKGPVDTMVQEAVPDGYRGRVSAVYDVAYNVFRLAGTGLVIPLYNHLGDAGTLAAVGVLLLLWSPVLPAWIGRAPEIRLRFYEGARAEEWPRAVVWGGVEEAVEVQRSWLEERGGRRLVCFRLALEDGTVLDVSRTEPGGDWRLDQESTR